MSMPVLYVGLVIIAFGVFMGALLFLQISDSRYRKQLELKAALSARKT